MEKIIVYSQDTCPKCKILEKKLNKANIEYEKFQDAYEIEKLGIKLVPSLNVDGKILHYVDAVKWVNERIGD